MYVRLDFVESNGWQAEKLRCDGYLLILCLKFSLNLWKILIVWLNICHSYIQWTRVKCKCRVKCSYTFKNVFNIHWVFFINSYGYSRTLWIVLSERFHTVQTNASTGRVIIRMANIWWLIMEIRGWAITPPLFHLQFLFQLSFLRLEVAYDNLQLKIFYINT